jgi:DNA-binding response OmpR family regulator
MEKIQVIHLEDDTPLQNIISIYIAHLAKDVVLFQYDGSDTLLESIQQSNPDVDLFLLDIRVPGELDGRGVAQKVRELGYDCPIIITSAYEVPEREWLQEYKCEWMIKPTHAIELQKRVIPLARQYHSIRTTYNGQ